MPGSTGELAVDHDQLELHFLLKEDRPDYGGKRARFVKETRSIWNFNVGGYVNEVAELFGLDPDPAELYAFPPSIAYQDTTGMRVVMACVNDAPMYYDVKSEVSGESTLLRGLLEHRRYVQSFKEGEPEVFMEAMLSTNGLNAVVSALGLVPGQNAIKFVRMPHGGNASLGEWTRGFAYRQQLQSGLDDPNVEPVKRWVEAAGSAYLPSRRWDVVQHDQKPSNHVIDTIVTSFSPFMVHAIAENAQIVVDRYGDDIDNPEHHADVVASIAEPADRLDILSRPTYGMVAAIDTAEISAIALLRERVESLVKRDIPHKPYSTLFPEMYVLKGFGLMPKDKSEEDAVPYMLAAFAEYACAEAELYLAVDAIRPRKDEDPELSAARVDAWQQIIQTCGPLALRGRSVAVP